MALERKKEKEEDDAPTDVACQWYDVVNVFGDTIHSFHPPPKPGKHVSWYKGTFDNWGAGQFHGGAWPMSYTIEGVFGNVTTTKNTCLLSMTVNGCFYKRCRSYHYPVLGTIVSALPGRNPTKLGVLNPAIRRSREMEHLMKWTKGQQAQIDALIEEETEKAEAELQVRQAAKAKRLAQRTRYLAVMAAAMEDEEDEEPTPKRPKIAMLAPVLSAAAPLLEFTATEVVAQEFNVTQQVIGVKREYQQMDGSVTPPSDPESSPGVSPTSPTISPAPLATAMGEVNLDGEAAGNDAACELFPGAPTAGEAKEATSDTAGELADEGKEAAAADDTAEAATAEEEELAAVAADNTAALADM